MLAYIPRHHVHTHKSNSSNSPPRFFFLIFFEDIILLLFWMIVCTRCVRLCVYVCVCLCVCGVWCVVCGVWCVRECEKTCIDCRRANVHTNVVSRCILSAVSVCHPYPTHTLSNISRHFSVKKPQSNIFHKWFTFLQDAPMPCLLPTFVRRYLASGRAWIPWQGCRRGCHSCRLAPTVLQRVAQAASEEWGVGIDSG